MALVENLPYVCNVTPIRNEYMKVTQKILDLVDQPQPRTRIAMKLGVGEQTIAVHMRRNTPDGRMTKMDFLQAISEESGFPVDEILETEGQMENVPQS